MAVIIPAEEKKQPAFKTFPESKTVLESKSAKFSITLESDPTKVAWLKDGKQVDEKSPRYKFSQEGAKDYIFEIPNCLVTDVGQYTVRATGKKGDTTAAFSLNVHTTDDL